MLKLLAFAALVCLVFLQSGVKGDLSGCVNYNSTCNPGDPCACLNNGTCVSPQFTTCTCNTNVTFYAGFYCEVPKCTGLGPKECNTGTCVSANVCNCTTFGWTGVDCSIPVCDNNPCANGNCTGPDTCTCSPGWASANCSVAENECLRAHKPCDPLSNCTNLDPDQGGYNCTACPAGYVGSPYVTYANDTDVVTSGGCKLPTSSSTSMSGSLTGTGTGTGTGSGQASTTSGTSPSNTNSFITANSQTSSSNTASTSSNSNSNASTSNSKTGTASTTSSPSNSNSGSTTVSKSATQTGSGSAASLSDAASLYFSTAALLCLGYLIQ